MVCSYEWYTPSPYVEAARRVLGHIDLDPASSAIANLVVGAGCFYTEEQNGLAQPWDGNVWLNPPYGSLAPKFVSRVLGEYETGTVPAAIVLLNAQTTSSGWFQPLWSFPLCFTDHRIKFTSGDGSKNSSPANGSVFIYMGGRQKLFLDVFERFGAVVARTTATPTLPSSPAINLRPSSK